MPRSRPTAKPLNDAQIGGGATGQKMSRTKRKPYMGVKAIDASCRNHGSCPHCAGGREAKHKRRTPLEQQDDKDTGNLSISNPDNVVRR